MVSFSNFIKTQRTNHEHIVGEAMNEALSNFGNADFKLETSSVTDPHIDKIQDVLARVTGKQKSEIQDSFKEGIEKAK